MTCAASAWASGHYFKWRPRRKRYFSALNRRANGPLRAGTYTRYDGRIRLMTRPFTYWDGKEAAEALELSFDGNNLVAMSGLNGRAAPDHARLDPAGLGRIKPAHHEVRVLVKLAE